MRLNRKGVSDMPALTPIPQSKAMTMNFPDAIKKIMQGKRVTRISWANKDYCLVKNGWLTINTKGRFHTWLVSEGDLDGNDWIIISEPN